MRLRAAWAREDLDRRLAEGAEPDSDPLLHTRAERLVTPASRAVLAAGLERAVAAAHDPGAALSSSAPVRRGPVRGARHELMGLAGELRHVPHPRPRGVAMAELLLTEGSSVLFTAESSAEVARAARDAVDHLRATSPEEPGALDDLLGVREASTSLRTTNPRTGEAAEHHFDMPSVARLPPRAAVESTNW